MCKRPQICIRVYFKSNSIFIYTLHSTLHYYITVSVSMFCKIEMVQRSTTTTHKRKALCIWYYVFVVEVSHHFTFREQTYSVVIKQNEWLIEIEENIAMALAIKKVGIITLKCQFYFETTKIFSLHQFSCSLYCSSIKWPLIGDFQKPCREKLAQD